MIIISYINRFSRCAPFSFAVFLMIVFAAPDISFADTPPPPRIESLVQQGQDVQITIRLAWPGNCWAYSDEACTLTRMMGGLTKDMFVDRVFSEEAASGSGEWCHPARSNEVYCSKNPSECLDCDGDDVPECDTDNCNVEFYFDIVDQCVWPGEVTYTIKAGNADEQSGPRDILVEDTGDECLDMDAGADVDADTDNDASHDTDDDEESEENADSADCSMRPFSMKVPRPFIINPFLLLRLFI